MADVNTVGDHTFEEVLADADADLQQVARATRALIAEILPGVTEVPWLRQKNVGYGVGPKKMSEHFCYIGLNKKHINLGFFYGADLPDPDGLLEGSGKLLRHVKLAARSDVERDALRTLVVAASQHLPKLK